MKKLTILIVLASLCLNFPGQALSQTRTASLQVGDSAANLPLRGLLNAPPALNSTAAYKGKLVILDFWATWCTSCLRKFPELAKLEQEFSGRLAVLGVTNEPVDKIRKWLTGPVGRSFHFPTVTGDTLLSKRFPHYTVPHYVWIGPEGTVRAITGPEHLTAANIEKALSSKRAKLQVKKDLDTERPLFLGDSYPEENPLLSYSLLSKGLYEGLPSGGSFRKTNGVIHGRARTNQTLLQLYDGAAFFFFEQLGQQYTSKRRVLKLKRPEGRTGLTSVVYNYDLIVPLARADSLWSDMLHDLNRVTGYHGAIEKRQTACYVLTLMPGQPVPVTQGGKARNTLFETGTSLLTNCPAGYLIKRMDGLAFLEAPVLDETGITAKVDLNFREKPTTLEGLNEQLKAQGLRLEKAERLLEMLVLSDTATGP